MRLFFIRAATIAIFLAIYGVIIFAFAPLMCVAFPHLYPTHVCEAKP